MKFFRYVKSVVLVVMSPNFPHLSALKFSKLTSYFIICSGSRPFKIRLPHFVVYLRNFILHNYHPPPVRLHSSRLICTALIIIMQSAYRFIRQCMTMSFSYYYYVHI
jgi:hypothetical protein